MNNLFFYHDWITHPECVRTKSCIERTAIIKEDPEMASEDFEICDDGCICGQRVIRLRTWFKITLIILFITGCGYLRFLFDVWFVKYFSY